MQCTHILNHEIYNRFKWHWRPEEHILGIVEERITILSMLSLISYFNHKLKYKCIFHHIYPEVSDISGRKAQKVACLKSKQSIPRIRLGFFSPCNIYWVNVCQPLKSLKLSLSTGWDPALSRGKVDSSVGGALKW